MLRTSLRSIVVLALVATAVTTAAEAPPLVAELSNGEELALPEVDPELPSPAAWLGYPLGERFTHWDRIRGYLQALDAASDRVALWDYGTTYLGRPLTLVAISSPRHLERLDALRAERRGLADPSALSADERRRLVDTSPAVVWLGYGVHGNESSSAEAAMAAAYLLAAATGDGWPERRDDTVVLIDPLSNPDGRERYVAGFEQRVGRVPDPTPSAREHSEPWPGGRTNHYLVDLNRDWSWATQVETRHRLAEFAAWQPQVYVDLHEMSYEATYFFPPSAQPVNPEIDHRTVRWLDVFGRGNGAAFDDLGWLYYKAESFDLFYPGYADSYASFQGAVGMTYEVGGGGRGGLVVRRADGTLLTLADRVARHLVASLATVETATMHRRQLVGDHLAGRLEQANRDGAETYLWPADHPEATALATLLARHGIAVRRLEAEAELPARPLPPAPRGEAEMRRFAAGTWAVSTGQPLGNLVRTLIEPETPMPADFVDEQRRRVEQDLRASFYDVTAWSLPLAYNVETWAATKPPKRLGPPLPPPADAALETAPPAVAGRVLGSGGVGWLVPPSGLAGYRFAARLQAAGVPYRVALADLALGGRTFAAGTLFVPRLGAGEGTAERIAALAAESGVDVHRVASSYSDSGLSLGSDRMLKVMPARVALLAGEGVAPSSLGSVWHLLDRLVELPVTLLEPTALASTDLDDFDVLVLPDDWGWSAELGDDAGEAVERWVKAGGVLVAIEGAVDWLRGRELTAVEQWQPAEVDGDDPEAAGDA
ncbi:MAG TPA: M14 family zinc carboxypeptidase, partial [Thermoanaerobaculia bacterium]|nr:M14 family zinc carboxypeptidase [Thermoanaerobaculia bacterium]